MDFSNNGKPEETCNILRFCDSYALKHYQLVKQDVWVMHEMFVDAQKLFYQHYSASSVYNINCSGCIISPGFIDVQINGL